MESKTVQAAILDNLHCPLSLELLVDPINLPCCMQTVSRHMLLQIQRLVCPMCNADISQFDIPHAPRNVALAAMVESLERECKSAPKTKWHCVMKPIIGPGGCAIGVCESTITAHNVAKEQRPNLVIAVVDRSGSMAGKAWSQVQMALQQLITLTHRKPTIRTRIVTYASTADEMRHEGDVNLLLATIRNLQAGGGTNFELAFQTVGDILNENADQVSCVTIVILTDGQPSPSTMSAELLPTMLGNTIQTHPMVREKNVPVVVHTIGFSASCDRDLLENLRKVGTQEGIFRFAEPQSEDEELYAKLGSIFQLINDTGNNFTLQIQAPHILPQKVDVLLHVNSRNEGQCQFYGLMPTERSERDHVTIEFESETAHIEVEWKDSQFDANLFNRWLSVQTDKFAAELLELASKPSTNATAHKLQLSLLRKKTEYAMRMTTQDKARLELLHKQITSLLARETINLGQVADMRFGSHFHSSAKKQAVVFHPPQIKDESVVVSEQQRREYRKVYDDCRYDVSTPLFIVDSHCNTGLHIAASRGRIEDVRVMLSRLENCDIDIENIDGETPLTLALKSRGYHITMNMLMQSGGARIPAARYRALREYTQRCGYTKTEELMLNSSDPNLIDESCSCETIQNVFATAVKIKIDLQHYLQVACAKQMTDFVCQLFSNGAVPTVALFFKYCIPKKPDDANVQLYLELAKRFLERDPQLIRSVETKETQETPLIKAAEHGNLPHVQLLLVPDLIDARNHLGNSALWIATAKAYPCIVAELLARNADPNATNAKGNPPLYNVCQRGPVKIANVLLTARARVDFINSNGDTAILLCARNGQTAVLSLLLDHVTTDFVNLPAKIDGFNAFFAAVEQDRSECIKLICDKHDIDINQHTAHDNKIVAFATPLHLAAHYGRVHAAEELLTRKASISSLDANDATPLHVAVMQGHHSIVKLLLGCANIEIHARDKFQNTPIMYAQKDPNMLRLFEDPLLETLMQIAKRDFGQDNEKEIYNVLSKSSFVEKWICASDLLDIEDATQMTPLLQSGLFSNSGLFATLVALNCDIHRTNQYGVSAALLVHWINNARMLQHQIVLNDQEKSKLAVLQKNIPWACGGLLCAPRSKSTLESGIQVRMSAGVEQLCHVQIIPESGNEQKELSLPQLGTFQDVRVDSEFLFQTHVQLINLVVSGQDKPLRPDLLFALLLYTNNGTLVCSMNNIVNDAICAALWCLPDALGNVYVASSKMDRSMLQVGKMLRCPHFLSASTLYSVALSHVAEFTTPANYGTVFVIESKRAKFIAPYVASRFEAEVIFAPNATFRIKMLCEGNIICLGQPDIAHTFQIPDSTWASKYENSNKSLIVVMEEIIS